MRIVAIIEARMTSSRLPGKVLLPALGRPMLAHLTSRLKSAPSIDAIVLATTTNASDDVLIEFAEQDGIHCFRGSELDVMGRVLGAAQSMKADVIVEITGDCPIIDPEIVEQTIRMFECHNAAYVSNVVVPTYPDGMATQVFTCEALRKSAAMTDDPLDREHVSRHIINHPALFSHVHLVAPPSMHWPGLGLTLDEPADYDLIRTLIEHFGVDNPHFGCAEIIRLLRQRPEWVAINAKVARTIVPSPFP